VLRRLEGQIRPCQVDRLIVRNRYRKMNYGLSFRNGIATVNRVLVTVIAATDYSIDQPSSLSSFCDKNSSGEVFLNGE
jgi:hypothetical protein